MTDAETAAAFRPHTDLGWQPADGYAQPGAEEKILFRQPDGAYARLLRWPPGFVTGNEPLSHPDVDEFAWVVSGMSRSLTSGVEATRGMFCAVEAGVDHGPFESPDGVLLLEVRFPAGRGEAQ